MSQTKGNEYKLFISVNLTQSCPPGFHISKLEQLCVCEPRLAQNIGIHQCSITNGLDQIARYPNQHVWIGYDQSHKLILHPLCPFDYCVNDRVIFPLNNTDIQCAYNRSGLLCGRCKEGYSLVLSTSHCRKCTNYYFVLLITIWSSTCFFPPCLQTDSGNRNAQWPSLLRQHCWCQSYHLSTC